MVWHFCPIDGNTYSSLFGGATGPRDFQRTNRAPGLCKMSSLPLLWYKTLGKQSGFIPVLSELPISSSQRKSSTSQEQVWVSSDLTNSARDWLSPSWSRSRGTMRLTGITHLREPSHHHHQVTRLLACISTSGSPYSQNKTGSQCLQENIFPPILGGPQLPSENTCYVLG